MQHSIIVGGSTAKRVINCPGSVALVAKMPPQIASKYAEEGTMLHDAIEVILGDGPFPSNLTPEQRDKLDYCVAALDEIDPQNCMIYNQEVRVGFPGVATLEGVFGSTDLIGRIGNRAIMLDWKFGDGVIVDAEENMQLMFYAAAAMRTQETQWVFDGATEIELVIVQPPAIRRWTTTPARIKAFEAELIAAVKEAQRPDARLQHGDHCRWCAAKPTCPVMTGAVDRALKVKIDALPAETIAGHLEMADLLESWISDLRALALSLLEKGKPVPGYKLVPKRATRQWADPKKASVALLDLGLSQTEILKQELISPAQAEKVLKKSKVALPDDLVVSVSSGTTMAPESDPRPAVVQIGQTLVAALSKLK